MLVAGAVSAQTYAVRPVRMIAQRFTDVWGQQIVVDNRAGASGMIGHERTARAAPDGYTLLMSTSAGLIKAAGLAVTK